MKNNSLPLTPEEYADRCWTYHDQYVDGVETDYIIVGKYIKKVVKRYKDMLNNKKYVFREDKVTKAFKFFSLLNIEHKNTYTQMFLLPWQCFFIACVFGFFYADDTNKRVFTEAFLFLSRKNGKTALAASIQLYGMVADGVANPQSILVANTSNQASVALNYAKDIVTHSPVLRSRLMGHRSRIIFADRQKQGFCQIFSTIDPARIEGFSPVFSIMDEVHNWENPGVYNALKTGTGARQNPLMMVITTAGSKTNGFCNDYLKMHKGILDGNIEGENTIGFIYQPDDGDDLTNPEIWAKASPSLGFIISLNDLKRSYAQAKYSTQERYAFFTKHLNIFMEDSATWVEERHLIPVFEDFDETQFYGCDVYVGMDLSKTTDLSSVVMYFEKDGMSYAVPYFWMAGMDGNTLRKSGKDLSDYIYDGYITKCETRTIDLDLIYNKIIEISQNYNLISVQYDPYNAPVLISRLKEAGLYCEIFRQTAMAFNAPLKILEEKIYKRTIKMKNPVLLWGFGNIVLYVDGNGNIKILKNKQLDSVDGPVALGMALGGHIRHVYGDEAVGIRSYLDNVQNEMEK